MNNKWSFLLGLLLYLLSFQANAKTVYYVKSGATGDGSSWSNASGSIQDMINKAMVGDEVWVAYGTYKAELGQHWGVARERLFGLKLGVSILGGFCGDEDSKQERVMFDRDQNDKIEPWEYKYETVLLSGISCYVYDWVHEIEKKEWHESFVSGLTITGDKAGITGDVFVTDCDIHHNRVGLSVAVVEFCNIHHNSVYGISGGNTRNSRIHHNGTERLSGTGNGGVYSGICHNCEIYKNEGGDVGGGYDSEFHDCNIYENYSLSSGGGLKNSTAYNCHIYNNTSQGGGGAAISSNLYNCIVENNTTEKDGGGISGGNAYNCIIRNNFAVGNGGGVVARDHYDSYLENCLIYGNEALNDGGGIMGATVRGCSIFNNKARATGGGVSNSSCSNCDIYNNYAPSYGGVADGRYTNCTIANNKSFSGNENNGSLTNCILAGSFNGNASYSIFTDSYVSGSGNFLATVKELKFKQPTSFIGNATNDKQLEELKNADFSLSKGSSAIDMGMQSVNQSLPIEDISGYPRPMGEKTDIGAHEFLSFRSLPYENKFDEKIPSINSGDWTVDKLPGKDNNYWYTNHSSYVTTTFFAKTVSNKIDLSFDFAGKYAKKDQQEKMHVVLAYLDSDKRDTIMTISNTDYVRESHFSKEISSWVKNRVFRVLFAVESSRDDNIVYCGITNLKITKQDTSVDILAEDKVCMYDGKPHAIDYQINDTRVDKRKAVVTYRKEEETASTTTPPTKAGIYVVQISIEDGSYFGMKEVRLTIEKANQTIQWTQQLRSMKAKERIRLEATATSGLPVEYSSENETIAKVERNGNEWWLIADTLQGEAMIKAMQMGNENYNLANSVLKTIRVEAVPIGLEPIDTDRVAACFIKTENQIYVKGLHQDCRLYLYDSAGRLCLLKETNDAELHIPIEGLGNGLYYLQVQNKGKRESFKVLIY